jgi:ribonuclease P protein component
LGSSLAHLVSKAQFDAVFAGKVISKTAHFALHFAVPEGAQGLAIGVVVPKRWARRAVTRNTIRRQAYAVSQSCAHSLAAGHYVVRLKTEFARTSFVSATSVALKQAVRAELHTLLLHTSTQSAATSARPL